MTTKLLAALVAIILSATDIHTHAEGTNDTLPLLQPKVKFVAAFKNGLAFVQRSGDTPLQNGWVCLEQLPPTALGTLWIGTTNKSTPVTEVIAYKEKSTNEVEAASTSELLRANVGRRISITYQAGSEVKSAEGVLALTANRRKDDEGLPPWNQPYSQSYDEPPMIAPIALVGTNSSTGRISRLYIRPDLIQSLELPEDAVLHTSIEKEHARTKIHIAGNPTHAEIIIAGLQKGIVWSPSYRIDLADENQARLELNAELADDQENLADAEIAFVVGYPNFAFAEIPSPMSLQQSVADFIQSLAAGHNTPRGGIMSQRVAYNIAPADLTGGYTAPQGQSTAQSEDFYLYRRAGVTLNKGDRARFNLLDTSAPYEHLYKWEVPNSLDVDDRGYRQNQGGAAENLVWHILRLANQGHEPWTTAPAFVVNDGVPVAQDTLDYTPAGGQSQLKLTVATDVRAEQTQMETNRQPVKIGGRAFDEITISGQLKVTNWKSKEITMLVRKSILGEVLESAEGKVMKTAHNLNAVNPNSEIEWEFKLPAGKDRELSYKYKVLMTR